VPHQESAQLPEILARGVLAYGSSTDLWTIRRIVDVTEAEWGVRYEKSTMWRLLKRHGLSWQRPSRQAREKNLVAVRNWKQRSWPRYKKKPVGDGP
jgi:transposase